MAVNLSANQMTAAHWTENNPKLYCMLMSLLYLYCKVWMNSFKFMAEISIGQSSGSWIITCTQIDMRNNLNKVIFYTSDFGVSISRKCMNGLDVIVLKPKCDGKGETENVKSIRYISLVNGRHNKRKIITVIYHVCSKSAFQRQTVVFGIWIDLYVSALRTFPSRRNRVPSSS